MKVICGGVEWGVFAHILFLLAFRCEAQPHGIFSINFIRPLTLMVKRIKPCLFLLLRHLLLLISIWALNPSGIVERGGGCQFEKKRF